jgi:peptidoglycan/LPS O-acetylase OafA/YrhL
VERYNGLDLARAVLMLLGIIYHVALIFEVDGNWEVANDSKGLFFHEIITIIHYFRMEAFYIISGFFFVMLFEKYGLRRALKDRLVKLGVPLIFVGLTLNSVMNLLIDEHHSNVMNISYITDGLWIFHLWFIGNLILYYLLLSPFLLILPSAEKLTLTKRTVLLSTFAITPILSSLVPLLGDEIITGRVLFIQFKTFYYYLPYFLLGMFYWKAKNIVIPLLTIKTSLSLLIIFLLLILFNRSLSMIGSSWMLSTIFKSLESLCLSISIIAFLSSIGQNRNKITDKLVNSSYSIYLLHQPLIIIIFVSFLADLTINPYLSSLILCVTACIASYLLHARVIKKSKICLFLLNGNK